MAQLAGWGVVVLWAGTALAQVAPGEPGEPGPDAPPGQADQPASAPATQPVAGQDKPWARGVSAEQQTRALALYREGNRLFVDEKYSEALERYKEALRHWDHPAIRYNTVECLVNLGRNLEAHAHLKSAMRHGEAPLGSHLHRQAKTYLNLLERSLARIRLVCRERGARVVLDGKPLFVGPGEATRLVAPGVHAVVASKPGFITVAQQPNLQPGKLAAITLRLIPRRPEVVFERRWSRAWVPWTVLGAGAAIAATALPLYLVARDDFETHRERFDALCAAKPAGGCVPDELEGQDAQEWGALQDLEQKAYREYHASIALLGVGAAVAASGIVLVILNQPRAVERRPGATPKLASVPVALVPGGARVGLLFRF